MDRSIPRKCSNSSTMCKKTKIQPITVSIPPIKSCSHSHAVRLFPLLSKIYATVLFLLLVIGLLQIPE